MVTISDEDIAYRMTIDASDYNSGIDSSISKLTDMDDTASRVGDSIQSSMDRAADSLTSVQDAAESATSSLGDVGNVSMDVATGGMNNLGSATTETGSKAGEANSIFGALGAADMGAAAGSVEELGTTTEGTTEKASETVDQFSLLDAIELAAVIEGVHLLGDALDECLNKFAELNDISTRSALFGGAGTSGGNLAGTTEAIMKQAEEVGLKLGVAPEGVAKMEGVLRQYQVDTSKMSNDQIGQYVALARTTQQDPSAVATEVLKTAKAFNIDDTQKVIDVAAKAYGQTGFDFSSAQMSLSKMAGDQTQKALGGITGEIAILQDLQQTTLPSRGAGVALNKAVEDWQNSSDAYQTQVEKINAKGKVSYSTKDVAATGMTDTATGQSIFSEAGLNTTLEKNKTFMEAMGDLYTQGKAKGVDYFSKMSGGMYLEELAKNQAVIQQYKAQNDNASGANDKLKNATDDLSVSLNRIGIAFDQVKTKIGSLIAGPAQAFADWVTGPALTGITKIIDDIEKGDWDGAISTIGEALGKIPGLVEKAIGDISIGDLLMKALGGAGGMIAGSDLVAMMGLPALIGGPLGALAGLAVGIIGTYLPQIISSFKNAVPGIVAEINGWINSIIATFSTTDFSKVGEDVGYSIFTSLSGMVSDAATALVNLFSGIDYTRVGIALYDILVAAWNFAWGSLANAGTWIQKWLDSSNFDLTGIFTGPLSALEGIFGPTFNHLENAAIDAWNVIGEGAVTLENAIGEGITGAIRTVISAFADLAGAADESLGGAIGKALGLKDALSGTTQPTAPGTPTTTTTAYPSWVAPQDIAKAKASGEYWDSTNQIFVNGDEMSASAPGRYTLASIGSTKELTVSEKAHQRELESAGSEMYGSYSGAQLVKLSEPVKIDTSGMKTQDLQGGLNIAGYQILPQYDTNKALGYGTPEEERAGDEAASQRLYNGVMSFAVAKEGNLPGITATNQKAAADIAQIPVEQQTSTQKAIAAGIANTNTLHTDLGIVATKLDDNATSVGDRTGNAVHDTIEKWNDGLAYQNQTWTDIKHVDETAAADAKTSAQDTKDGLAGLDGDMQRQIDAMNNAALKFPDVTDAAATKTAATYTPSMFYGGGGSSTNTNTEGGYIGPTVNYPAYRDQIDAQKADAQAINEKYVKTSVGSISMKIDADTTPAEAKKATLESDVTAAKPILSVGADTTKAMADINKLITWVITSRPVMTVQVQVTASADEIQAQVEAAIRKAAA